ncbi:MAG: prepilin-type N-terminal cleavage/methylation domain-containing protein [Planctomycetota bacterium]
MTIKRANPRGGFTLIEVAIVIVIISVAVMGLMATISRIPVVEESNDEEIVALRACKAMMEQLVNQAETDFPNVYARYNGTVADDPVAGASPGNDFDVDELIPMDADADGMCGGIEFPELNDILNETVSDTDFGVGGIDMDGDGTALDADVRSTYRLLPVRVVVNFKSISGNNRQQSMVSILYGD